MSHPLVAPAVRVLAGGLVGLLVFGCAFLLFVLAGASEAVRSLSVEDGLIEWLGALAFAAAATLQVFLFWTSDVPPGHRLIPFMRRNPLHLALAVALFLAFAEEISWGQRIFGWETPAAISAMNRQDETNLHNLDLFQGGLFSLTRLWNLFWLSYAVLLPISNAAVPPLRALYRRISVPVPPLWIAGLFLGCYASFRLFIGLAPEEARFRPDEAKEAFLAMCWVVLAVAQLRQRAVGNGSDPPRPVAQRVAARSRGEPSRLSD